MEILDFVFGPIAALPGWLFPAAIVTILVLRIVLHLRSWIGRGVTWQRMASQLGLQFRSDMSDLSSHFPALGMLVTSGGTRWVNVLSGESDGLSICLADRCGSRAVNRTVCIVRSSDLHSATLPSRSSRRGLDVEALDDTVVVSYGRLINPTMAPELLAVAKEATIGRLHSSG